MDLFNLQHFKHELSPMSFVSFASYTRSVKTRLKRNQIEVPIFKGSSFNRKKIQVAEETQGKNGEANNDGTIEQMALSVRQDSNNQSSDNWSLETSGHRKKRANGNRFSSRSRNKCKEKISALFGSCDARNFSFMTLTFIAPVSDQQGVKILNKYLTVLRKRFGKFMYVWVAEHQPGTRNIHFHVIQNRKFPISYINALWVQQQYNAGLSSEKINVSKVHEIYFSKNYKAMQKFLNPVDIKPVHSISGLAGYLTQYVTKNNDIFHCAVWHSNRGVSALFTSSQITEQQFMETCDETKNRYTNKRTGKVYINKTFIVTDKTTGEIRSFVNTIYNQEYFKKNHNELNQLNQIVAELYYKNKRIERDFLYQSQADFFQSLYNQLN